METDFISPGILDYKCIKSKIFLWIWYDPTQALIHTYMPGKLSTDWARIPSLGFLRSCSVPQASLQPTPCLSHLGTGTGAMACQISRDFCLFYSLIQFYSLEECLWPMLSTCLWNKQILKQKSFPLAGRHPPKWFIKSSLLQVSGCSDSIATTNVPTRS